MTLKNSRNRWLGAMAFAGGLMTSACGGLGAENATSTVSQAVEEASNASDAVEVSSLLRGLNALRPQAVEGFHCDSTPDITYVDICGKSLPATVHLEWTDCAAPQRPGGEGRSGGQPPRPPPGYTGGTGGGSAAGTPPVAGAAEEGGGCGRGGPLNGPSSGTVDVAYTYSAAEDCSGAITQAGAVTFQISRTAQDGSIATVQGSTSSSAEIIGDAPPRQKQTTADVTRSVTDASGAVVRSVHLTGSMSVEFSSDTPPTRTINGSYNEELNDGTTGTVTLAGIVRPPRSVCPWPTSGTLTRANSAGETHTLVFGPECGAATLDGNATQLPQRGGPRQGRR